MTTHHHSEINRIEIREHIIDVATQAFHTQGVKNVTMDDIAHALTMSKRTLYQIFSDKEDLILACMQKHHRHLKETLSQTYKENPNVLEILLKTFEIRIRFLQGIDLSFFEEIEKYPKIIRYAEETARAEEAEALDFLQRGVEQGYFLPGLNYRIIYNQFHLQMKGIKGNEVLKAYSLPEIFASTIVIYFRGCATLKGVTLIDQFLQQLKEQMQTEAQR
ncbi:MAG: TetR/AcrR family transcriptional regulator [Alloprevotella sp.]